MSEQNIKCPQCGHTFALTDAMTKGIEENLRAEYNQKWKQKETEFRAKLEVEAQQKAAAEVLKLKAEIDACNAEIARGKEELKVKLEQEKGRAREELAQELQFLKERNEEQARKLQEAKAAELALLRKEQELTERAQNLELEMTRRLAELRGEVEAAARKRADEEHALKHAEKEKQLADALKQVEEMKRKLEQGSQQAQGEILELELEEQLRLNFADDEIQPVAKGVRGGDVMQRITTASGSCCILWEFKNTKNWTEGWIPKLKQDQRECKADLAVIVTRALPKELTGFGLRDGVWVTDFASAIGLGFVLRESLVQIGYARTAAEGMSYKMELIYKYLAGPEFRQRVEAIVEKLLEMKKDLEDERRRIYKLWEKRETQIMIMQQSTIAIHGKLHAIIGNALSEIPLLEMPESADGTLKLVPQNNGNADGQ